jgi:oxygen-independent coproporphyrinogen III oxidase
MNFGLYIHIPYCIQKCPYCDFNSYGIQKKEFQEVEYVEALCREFLQRFTNTVWEEKTCRSIFFGGGTPSLLSEESFEKIFTTLFSSLRCSDDCEITIEANPGTVFEQLTVEKLKTIRKIGVNRISFGSQSFSERKLKFLGRLHLPHQILSAVQVAREANFEEINLDLIFGAKGETLEEWQADLRQVLELQPTHISAYSLTIEPGTEFGAQARKGFILTAEEERVAELFIETQEILSRHGYHQYEVSNYSKPGNECRHNLGYWRGESYLSIGAGAVGFLRDGLTGTRYKNIPGPEEYISRITKHEDVSQVKETLTAKELESEFFLLRMRLSEGFSEEEYSQSFQKNLSEHQQNELGKLIEQGLLNFENNRYFSTQKGFLMNDQIVLRLV